MLAHGNRSPHPAARYILYDIAMINRRRLLSLTLALLLAPAAMAALAAAAGPAADESAGRAASPAVVQGASNPSSGGPLLVFAAASLTNALNAIGPLYTGKTGEAVTFSYGASSTLARQISAGAQAEVFFSADTDWMDFLQSRHLIDPATRRDIVGNRLALIAPS